MTALERRWSDLKFWRLCLGLVVAPSPACAVFLVLGAIVERPAIVRLLWYARVMVQSTAVWSILVALAYLLIVTAWRRKIARWECLLLGGLSGLTFPYAIIYFRHYAPGSVLAWFGLMVGPAALAEERPHWTNAMDDTLLACFCAFGLLGGWILWGVGVRSAAPPPPDTAIFE